MGLVNDAITLAKAGTSPTSGALDLIAGLKNETESSLVLLPMLDTADVTMYRSCLGEYRLDYRVGQGASVGTAARASKEVQGI